MIEVNLLGLLYCTHAALPIMGAAGSGDIVNVSSVAGRIAGDGERRLQHDQVGRRRLLGGAAPGVRRTPASGSRRSSRAGSTPSCRATTSTRSSSSAMEKMIEKIGKVLEPEDIARAIAFAVTQPPHVSINEMLIRPTRQSR